MAGERVSEQPGGIPPSETARPGASSGATSAVERLVVAADPAAWAAAGFRVEGGELRVGSVTLELAGPDAGRRIVRCTLSGVASGEFDGLPVEPADGADRPADAADRPADAADRPADAADRSADAAGTQPPGDGGAARRSADAVGARPVAGDPPAHPNGVVRIDHVVAFTPDLDRTVAAGRALGLDLRRIRDEPAPAGSPRQAFFRIGELLLEIAQAPDGSPLAGDSPARFYGLAFVVEDIDATVAALGDLCGEPRDAIQPGRRIATVRREANLGLPIALMTPRAAS